MKLDNPLVQWEHASEERLAKRNETCRELLAEPFQTRSTHCVFVAVKTA